MAMPPEIELPQMQLYLTQLAQDVARELGQDCETVRAIRTMLMNCEAAVPLPAGCDTIPVSEP
jgi:hypothetical protein